MFEQIPAQSFVTTQVLKKFDEEIKVTPNKSIRQYYEEQRKNCNVLSMIPNFPVINSGYAMMLAYAMIVVPYQAVEKLEEHNQEVEKLEKHNIKYDFSELNLASLLIIDKKYQGYSNYEIIRHIRNSIAHVRYEIKIKENKFIFKDCKGGDEKKENFKAVATQKELLAIISEFYNYYQKKILPDFKKTFIK